MDIQLNFLQFQPQKNWFDYFVNRKEINDLLSSNAAGNHSFLINLCDQFIEQALLTESDLAQSDKRNYDQEDLICLRHKSEDLWLFATSCFASAGWDLDLLNNCSNVMRIQAFLDRLTRWAYENENEQSLLNDPFNFICSSVLSEKFDPSNIFIAWLYTRWIFSVYLYSKFPIIPAKPTVSNPCQYVDTNLLQAEKFAQITNEIQQKMPQAVKLMNLLIECEEKSEEGGIEIPLKECFYPKLDIITKGCLLVPLISNFPKPNFENGKKILDRNMFKIITSYDLLVAHFSSRHLTQAKLHLINLQKYWAQTKNKENLFFYGTSNFFISINKDVIKGYSIALGILKADSEKDENYYINEEESLMEFAKHRPKQQKLPHKLLVKMLTKGTFRIPKFYREKELRIEESQKEFIKNLYIQLNELRKIHLDYCNMNALLLGSLYFLCTHCVKFAASLENTGLKFEGFKTRNFANISMVVIPPVPVEEQFQEFTNTEIALWNLLTTFDINVMRNSFARLDSQITISSKRMIFSPISADPILTSTSAAGDRFFSRNQMMLWKLEQLARLGNKENWKDFLNKFSQDCKAISEHKFLLLFDTLRIQLANWNSNFYRPNEPIEFNKDTTVLKKLIYATMASFNAENKISFQLLSGDLISYILNNREWKFVMEHIKGQTQFESPFTNIVIMFSVFFSKLYLENKRNEAFKIAHEVIWKFISPIFDSSSKTGHKREGIIKKEQLLEILDTIKDIDVISIFIGLTSYLYNFVLSTNQKPLNISINFSFDANISTLSGVAAAMDNSVDHMDDGTMHQQSSTQLLRNVGRSIYEENVELWKAIKIDNSYEVDIVFIEKVLDLLSRQAELVAPIYLPWLRFRADYAFVRERYQESAKLYLEILMAFDRNLLGKPNIAEEDNEWTKRLIKRIQIDKDTIYGKLSVSLHFLQMPILASIVGQMRSDNSHLNMVDTILRNTPNTVDSGPIYFPLIADIHLVERMAAIYEHFSVDLLLYRQALLKLMPTRAININNSADILNRDYKRRKERFIEVLYKQFFVT